MKRISYQLQLTAESTCEAASSVIDNCQVLKQSFRFTTSISKNFRHTTLLEMKYSKVIFHSKKRSIPHRPTGNDSEILGNAMDFQ